MVLIDGAQAQTSTEAMSAADKTKARIAQLFKSKGIPNPTVTEKTPTSTSEKAPLAPNQIIPMALTMTPRTLPDVSSMALVVRPELDVIGVVGNTDIVPDNEWEDRFLLEKAGIRLVKLGDQELIPLCDIFVKDMVSGVSEYTAGALVLLAWQLRSVVKGKMVFPDQSPSTNQGCVDLATLSRTIIYPGGGNEFVKSTDLLTSEYTRCVCFIAASMIRILSKSPASYKKAYESHIKEAYYKFYKSPFPIREFEPSQACLDGIGSLFANLDIYRNTIGILLYCHYGLTNDRGMCNMLYEQHIGLTGMHVVQLFIRACAAMHCPGEELASISWNRLHKGTLITLMWTIKKYIIEADKDARISRRTWKYSRLYDTKYFLMLQTKICKELVCLLAHVCILAGVQGNQNILDIAHVKSLPAETMERYNRWAMYIYAKFCTGAAAADGNIFAH